MVGVCNFFMPSRNWQFAETPSWMDFMTPGCTPNTRKNITHWWKCAAWKFLDINKKINMLQAPKLWEMNKASICVTSHQILGNLLIEQKPNAKIYQDLTPYNTCTRFFKKLCRYVFWALLMDLPRLLYRIWLCKVKIKARTKAIAAQLPVLLVATRSDCDCMFAVAFMCWMNTFGSDHTCSI